jgi:hypothetical protein
MPLVSKSSEDDDGAEGCTGAAASEVATECIVWAIGTAEADKQVASLVTAAAEGATECIVWAIGTAEADKQVASGAQVLVVSLAHSLL